MDNADLRVRRLTYAQFVDLGRAPTPIEVAARAGLAEAEILASWRRLHEQHALVLNADGTAIRMVNPFSAVPTPYRVQAAGRWWYGNCAWDAFGICAALGVDGRVESPCPDCGDLLVVEVRDRRPMDQGPLFHCLLPAAIWWNDIVFT